MPVDLPFYRLEHKLISGFFAVMSCQGDRMSVLPLEQIRPGMMLNKDVQDLSGRLLLGREAEINQQHLRIFRAWGVTEADVRGAEQPQSGLRSDCDLLPPDLRAEVMQQAGVLFMHTDISHPFMGELHRETVMKLCHEALHRLNAEKTTGAES